MHPHPTQGNMYSTQYSITVSQIGARVRALQKYMERKIKDLLLVRSEYGFTDTDICLLALSSIPTFDDTL